MTTYLDAGHGRLIAFGGQYHGWLYQRVGRNMVRLHKAKTCKPAPIMSPFDGLLDHKARKRRKPHGNERRMAS